MHISFLTWHKPSWGGIFVQKNSYCGNATGGDELHQSQQSEPGSNAYLIGKSWGNILKSWAPTNSKSFLFTTWALVLLPVGVIHLAQTGDSGILTLVFGAVCAYCGIQSGIEMIKTTISLLSKNKN